MFLMLPGYLIAFLRCFLCGLVVECVTHMMPICVRDKCILILWDVMHICICTWQQLYSCNLPSHLTNLQTPQNTYDINLSVVRVLIEFKFFLCHAHQASHHVWGEHPLHPLHLITMQGRVQVTCTKTHIKIGVIRWHGLKDVVATCYEVTTWLLVCNLPSDVLNLTWEIFACTVWCCVIEECRRGGTRLQEYERHITLISFCKHKATARSSPSQQKTSSCSSPCCLICTCMHICLYIYRQAVSGIK